MSASTMLSSSVTVTKYQQLEQSGDRVALAKFIRERFNERYFDPIEATPKNAKHGFTIMAVCCLVIEALESFYQGKADTRGQSSEMFKAFFNRDTDLKIFGGSDWFFRDIRCAILHQSETRNGWRIQRYGQLLDTCQKQINATKFMKELKKAVDVYADSLPRDTELWDKFKQKMAAVCANCE